MLNGVHYNSIRLENKTNNAGMIKKTRVHFYQCTIFTSEAPR